MKKSEKYFERLQSGDRTFHEIKRYGEYCTLEERLESTDWIKSTNARIRLNVMAKEDNL